MWRRLCPCLQVISVLAEYQLQHFPGVRVQDGSTLGGWLLRLDAAGGETAKAGTEPLQAGDVQACLVLQSGSKAVLATACEEFGHMNQAVT